uniref:Uncharacterized protein n=1 Tax=Arundo donax TaxID=35708 RepID=A0A0A9AE33_ARUDO
MHTLLHTHQRARSLPNSARTTFFLLQFARLRARRRVISESRGEVSSPNFVGIADPECSIYRLDQVDFPDCCGRGGIFGCWSDQDSVDSEAGGSKFGTNWTESCLPDSRSRVPRTCIRVIGVIPARISGIPPPSRAARTGELGTIRSRGVTDPAAR